MSKLSSYQQNKLKELILKHNLLDAGQIILASAVECWSFALSEPEDFSAVGNSRIGGDPDLPATLAWPQTDESLYLNFIMQINLAELPPLTDHPLPKQGMLYFFVESDEVCTDVKARLIYHNGDSAGLNRVRSPDYDQLVHEYYVDLEPHKLVPLVTIDLPEYGSETYEMVEMVSRDTPFGTIAERYCKLLESVSCADQDVHIVSKILGHASEVEGDMRWNACLHKAGQNILICNHHKQLDEVEELLQKALRENEAPEVEYYRKVKESLGWYQQHKEQLHASRRAWLQLLKIDSNRSVDLSIWYAGSFYILIREEDLCRHDFSNIYVETVAG